MATTALAETFKSRISLPPGLPKPNPTPAVWQQPPHPTIADAQSSTLPGIVDVAIIGSGITGCAAAHALLHQSNSCRVVVLEARQAASGATGRNGGHLISGSSGLVPRLVQAIGSEAAREVAMFSDANIARVKQLVQTLEEEARKAVELRDVIGTAAFSDASIFAEAEKGLRVLKDVIPVSGQRHRSIPAAEAIEVIFCCNDQYFQFTANFDFRSISTKMTSLEPLNKLAQPLFGPIASSQPSFASCLTSILADSLWRLTLLCNTSSTRTTLLKQTTHMLSKLLGATSLQGM